MVPRRGVRPARGDNQRMVVLPKRGVTPKGNALRLLRTQRLPCRSIAQQPVTSHHARHQSPDVSRVLGPDAHTPTHSSDCARWIAPHGHNLKPTARRRTFGLGRSDGASSTGAANPIDGSRATSARRWLCEQICEQIGSKMHPHSECRDQDRRRAMLESLGRDVTSEPRKTTISPDLSFVERDNEAWPVDRKGRPPPKMMTLIEAVRSCLGGGHNMAPDNCVRVSRIPPRRVRVMSGLQCGSRGGTCP
jgi:hypothetical protein